MMTCDQLKTLIETNLPDSKCRVFDLTGTSDHFEVQVVSPAFAGKSLIEQHKLVHKAVGAHLTTTIHALQIKTSTP
jgi:stress-induced morphogen